MLRELGEIVCIFAAPATMTSVALLILFACSKDSCTVISLPKIPQDLESYFNSKALITFAWIIAIQALLTFILPGKEVEELQSHSGKKRKYKMNGFLVMLFTVVPLAVSSHMKVSLDFAVQHTVQMVVAGGIVSFILSVLLYIKSTNAPAKNLAEGSLVHHFLNGREIGPQIGMVDLKAFFIQTGFIMFLVVDILYVLKFHDTSGKLNLPLIVVAALQSFYTLDSLWHQTSWISMADYNGKNAGFFSIFGSLGMLPFFYSLQTRFLLEHPQNTNNFVLAVCVVLFFTGLVMMRGANAQKEKFRRNPNDPAVAHLETIPSPSGKKLLVSGWWGVVRRPNYLGDIMTSLAWTLPCGLNHIFPYMFPAMLVANLISRAYEEDALCEKKHGAAWKEYRRRVKYMIIPCVF